jgi:hypothetical protein
MALSVKVNYQGLLFICGVHNFYILYIFIYIGSISFYLLYYHFLSLNDTFIELTVSSYKSMMTALHIESMNQYRKQVHGQDHMAHNKGFTGGRTRRITAFRGVPSIGNTTTLAKYAAFIDGS